MSGREIREFWRAMKRGDVDGIEARDLEGFSLKINGRLTRVLGRCVWDRGREGNRIELAKWLVETRDSQEIRDTLLHEVAHAIAGPTANHGPDWKMAARMVGARPETKCRKASIVSPSQKRPPKYTVLCPSCKAEFGRKRAPKGYGGYPVGSIFRTGHVHGNCKADGDRMLLWKVMR